MKTGDLEPPWQVACGDDDQTADLSGVDSWKFIVGLEQDGAVLFIDTNPTVTVGPDGNAWERIVTHTWADGDTERDGTYVADIQAIWPDGRVQTFPSEGHAILKMERSIE